MIDFVLAYLAIGCLILAIRWGILMEGAEKVAKSVQQDAPVENKYAATEGTRFGVFLLPIIQIILWPLSVYRRIVRGSWTPDILDD